MFLAFDPNLVQLRDEAPIGPLDQIRGKHIDFYLTGVGKSRFTVVRMRKFILIINYGIKLPYEQL